MKMFVGTLMALCFLNLSIAEAFDRGAILEDLARVDNLDCDIEYFGPSKIRILARGYNLYNNRYFDLNIEDERMIFKTTDQGWEFNKIVSNYPAGSAPLFPAIFYGSEVTKLTYRFIDGRYPKHRLEVNYQGDSKTRRTAISFACESNSSVPKNPRECPLCLSFRSQPLYDAFFPRN